jgi:hypothetical protein
MTSRWVRHEVDVTPEQAAQWRWCSTRENLTGTVWRVGPVALGWSQRFKVRYLRISAGA